MVIMHNRIELGGIVDAAPEPISLSMVRVRLRQTWSYASKGHQQQHVQRIYCVFLRDTAPLAQQLLQGDNVWVLGQLIRRPKTNKEQAAGSNRESNFTYEVHVLEAHIVKTKGYLREPDYLAELEEQPPDQERTRHGVRAGTLNPLSTEAISDWPL